MINKDFTCDTDFTLPFFHKDHNSIQFMRSEKRRQEVIQWLKRERFLLCSNTVNSRYYDVINAYGTIIMECALLSEIYDRAHINNGIYNFSCEMGKKFGL